MYVCDLRAPPQQARVAQAERYPAYAPPTALLAFAFDSICEGRSGSPCNPGPRCHLKSSMKKVFIHNITLDLEIQGYKRIAGLLSSCKRLH